MIAEIKKLIETCPLLKDGKINVNYLGDDDLPYSIDAVPSNPVVKSYVDGSEVRQYLFIFASRELYTERIKDNADVAKFYEDFSNWIEEINNTGNIPIDLGDKYKALSIEVLTGGYLFNADETTARYQIQCRLTYYKE